MVLGGKSIFASRHSSLIKTSFGKARKAYELSCSLLKIHQKIIIGHVDDGSLPS